MSVMDLLILIRRNIMIFIVAAVLGLAASCIYVFAQPGSYTATATLVVSHSPASSASFLVGYSAPDGVSVSYTSDSRTKTVKVIATSAEKNLCIPVANEAASFVASETEDMYSDREVKLYEATKVVTTPRSVVKFAVAGMLAGLALAFALVMVLWAKRKPVLSNLSLERAFSASCLYDLSTLPPLKWSIVPEGLMRIHVGNTPLVVGLAQKSSGASNALQSLMKIAKDNREAGDVVFDTKGHMNDVGFRVGLKKGQEIVLLVDKASFSLNEVTIIISGINSQQATLVGIICC